MSWGNARAQLTEVTRRWASLGQQVLPSHVVFGSVEDLATFLGADNRRLLRDAQQRHELLERQWPGVLVPDRVLSWLVGLSAEEADLAVRAVEWLLDNPDADLFVRQLPIVGVDTKWFERHRNPLNWMYVAVSAGTGCSSTEAGFRRDRPRCRIRLLDCALRAAVGGLADFSCPVDDLAHLSLGARCALVVENLQTFLACPDLPGTVLFFGAGYQANLLGTIGWLRELPLLYWGDIDTAGFEILHSLRLGLPQARSFAMDEATLLAHRELWVDDPKQRFSALSTLTPDERMVFEGLQDGRYGKSGIRMEQERLVWTETMHRLVKEVADVTA